MSITSPIPISNDYSHQLIGEQKLNANDLRLYIL